MISRNKQIERQSTDGRSVDVSRKRRKMRDKRFRANHAGGPLTIENHKLLIIWAIKCVEHAIEISNLKSIDQRALNAIQIAKEWEK